MSGIGRFEGDYEWDKIVRGMTGLILIILLKRVDLYSPVTGILGA